MPDEDDDTADAEGADEPRSRRERDGDPASATAADEPREEPADGRAHLADVDVGAGCTEIWEHLAERRRER